MKINKSLMLVVLSVCTFLGVSLINTNDIRTTSAQNRPETLHIIFDMNGVLVKNKEQSGIKQLFASMLRSKYKKKLFTFLESLEPRCPGETCACDGDGLLIPQIMCNWLKGTQKPQEILAKIDAAAHRTDTRTVSIARSIFDPQQFVATQKLVPETIQLVKDLKQQGHKVYILSNWDSESFKLMKASYADIFALFDGIMISGDVGMIKPDNSIYTHLLAQCNIPCTNACFIDDQPANVAAGCKANIHSIECKNRKKMLTTNPDIAGVRKELYAWINNDELFAIR